MSDLEVTRGDDRQFNLAIVDANGAAVDLTGAQIKWQARKHFWDADPLISKDQTDGITIDADQVTNKGKAVLVLVPADTSGLDNYEQVLKWDLQVTLAGKTTTVESGTLTVNPEVSQ